MSWPSSPGESGAEALDNPFPPVSSSEDRATAVLAQKAIAARALEPDDRTDDQEVRTDEAPEADVPGEYLDKE